MTEGKSLESTSWGDYPEVITQVSTGQVQLCARIIADELMHFIPEENLKDVRAGESGLYKILDVDSVLLWLEEFHLTMIKGDTFALSRFGTLPIKLPLKRISTSNGEVVFIVRKEGDALEPVSVPLSRIIIQDTPDKTDDSSVRVKVEEAEPKKGTRTYRLKKLAYRYFDQTNGEGDFNGYIEFLLDDPEIDEGLGDFDGYILYPIGSNERKPVLRTSLQKGFPGWLEKWKSLPRNSV